MSRVIPVLIVILLPSLAAQDPADETIRSEYQTVMELAAAPADGRTLDEEQAKTRAELFRKSLEAFVEKWRGRSGELDEGRYHLGRGLAITGHPDEAIPHLKAFITAHPGSPDNEDAVLLLGSAQLDTRDFAAAAQVFASFLAERPKSDRRTTAEYYLAVAQHRMGRTDEAIGHLRAVIASGEESPLLADAHIQYVQILRDSGRVDEARKHLDGLLEKNADAPALKALKEQFDWLGKEAPELSEIDAWLQGGPHRLQDLRGKVVVLNFFADKYEACQFELKALAELRTGLGDADVVFIGLTRYHRPEDKMPRPAEQELLKGFVKDMGVAFPVAVAKGVTNLHAYGVRGIPYTVVIGKDGRIAHVKSGGSRKNERAAEDLAAAIRRAL